MAKVSVYNIYVLCLLMAIGAAILSGVMLGDTFKAQQAEREVAQRETGLGQLNAVEAVIGNQLARMRTTTEANRQEFLMKASYLKPADFAPDVVMDVLNSMFFASWASYIKAEGQLYGFTVILVYAINSSSYNLDRNIQVWVDTLRDGSKMPVCASTFNNGTETFAHKLVWPTNGLVATRGNVLYSFNTLSYTLNFTFLQDFYLAAVPWAAADGYPFWFFDHHWHVEVFGVQGAVSAQDSNLEWRNRLLQLRVADSNFIIFDSNDRVLAATCDAEAERLETCIGNIQGNCLDIPANAHPVAEIQTIFNALVQPYWRNLSSTFPDAQVMKLRINGTDHIVISHLLFSRDALRLIGVWYQPWTKETGDITGITALVCALTVLSTFLLTLLGIWGILQPMKRLGTSVQTVTSNLKQGVTEASIQVAQSSPFKEVHSISKDFETIVVDFLGFSVAAARDNRHAPKDATHPFAVIFTDIESSTRLWGKNPQAMSKCIHSHHAIIRDLIKQHGLYEVKTIGDSFMVVGTSAAAAITFALDIQEELWQYDWGWDGVDEFYKAAHCDEGAQATDCKFWNGLRVRIGVHYNSGDITYDEVSKGYDYYGNVVNMAARIESVGHGGQVLVSETAFTAAKSTLDRSKMVVEPLGKVSLRGVAEAPSLLQIMPKSLCGRRFPPLRTDEECDIPQETTLKPRALSVVSTYSVNVDHLALLEEFSQAHSLVKSGVLPHHFVKQHLTMIYHFLDDLMVPLGTQQTSVLHTILKAWGIRTQQGTRTSSKSTLQLVQRMADSPQAHEQLRKLYDAGHPSPRVDLDALPRCFDVDSQNAMEFVA